MPSALDKLVRNITNNKLFPETQKWLNPVSSLTSFMKDVYPYEYLDSFDEPLPWIKSE